MKPYHLSILLIGNIMFSAPALSQGMAEMGAVNAMGAGMGSGLMKQSGSMGRSLGGAYGAVGQQLGAGSSEDQPVTVFGNFAAGVQVDPRLTVKNAGKESNRLFDLAVAKQKAGSLVEAEKYYKQSLAVRERIWGLKDPAVPKIIGLIGDIETKRGNLSYAEKCYHQVLAVDVKRYGQGEFELCPALTKLGLNLYNQKKYQDAYNYLNQAFMLTARKKGEADKQTVTAAINLAKVCADSNNQSDVIATLKKCINARQMDDSSPEMLTMLKLYSAAAHSMNKDGEAAVIDSRIESITSAKPADPTMTEKASSTTVPLPAVPSGSTSGPTTSADTAAIKKSTDGAPPIKNDSTDNNASLRPPIDLNKSSSGAAPKL